MDISQKKLNKILNCSSELEEQDAHQANTLGFMPKMLVTATLPHRDPKGHYYERTNGDFSLVMIGNKKLGLPYGSHARLLIAWVTTYVNQNKNKLKKEERLTVPLGKSFASFSKSLKFSDGGGERGEGSSLRKQMLRLFSTQISFVRQDETKGFYQADQYLLTRSFSLWWNPLKNNDDISSKSSITLSQDFYDALIDKPVPIDFRALQTLRQSPFEIDIYVWLTYRFSYLQKSTVISWASLRDQFGAGYPNTPQGLRNFKYKFSKALQIVLGIYLEANVSVRSEGLHLFPSQTHVSKKTKKEAIL